MQEDKKLQEFLMKHAVEETSVNFTDIVMQRIQTNTAARLSETPLLKQRLIRILVAAFFLVFVMLLMLSISMQPSKFPFHFSVELPVKYFSEIISFLIAFWVVMIINQVWNKKRVQVL